MGPHYQIASDAPEFMNDWNFFVRDVGRGRGVQERSLKLQKCHDGVGGDDVDMKPG